MIPLRLLGRAVTKSPFRSTPLRSLSSITLRSSPRPSWLQPFQRTSYSAFSTSIARREPAGDSDPVLADKFKREHELEVESRDTSKASPTIEEFLSSSGWSLQDKPGTHEVVMSKDFGNEKIKIEFSIADMQEIEEDDFDDIGEDTALADEDFDQSKKTINQSAAKGGKFDQAPEDSIAPADREGEEPQDQDAMGASYPLSLHITITKPGNKAIEVRALAQDGSISTESVNYFPDTKMMNAKSPEDILKARALYAGPPFGNLDPDLQALFEEYLEERGIDTQLAMFCHEYVELKEQKEYVGWLKNMKDFIDI